VISELAQAISSAKRAAFSLFTPRNEKKKS
jgi:hypothetical protein